MSALLKPRAEEAVDFALAHGLLKIAPGGHLAHAPFALSPSPIPPALHERILALTAPFNRLAHAVSRDSAFLEAALEPAARSDGFTARLLALAREGAGAQPLHLGIIRGDYFIHQPAPGLPADIRQVELNTISASYPGLSALVNRLHRHLLGSGAGGENLVRNDPLPPIADAIAEACSRYGHPSAVVAMVVQSGEANRFDQRLLEFALAERGWITRRWSLEEIATRGKLRQGHLVVDGETAAVTYFRAGYGPEDYRSEDDFKARALIEAASTIAVPGLNAQLAGAKKVQQLLTAPATLRHFLPEAEARLVESSFAAQFDLEQPTGPSGDGAPAWKMALEQPGRFVLKPQREGGGHNFFGEALRDKLASLSAGERSAFVLMERLFPPAHDTILVKEGQLQDASAVSEIGRFGAFLADGDEVLINADAGYLVRTKARDTSEGGVSAGFGFLDSLLLE